MPSERAAILGVGMTKFAKHQGRAFSDLGGEAVRECLKDAGIEWAEIQAVYCGNVLAGMLPGQRIVREFASSDIPVINVENACASAGTALHLATRAIETGQYDAVLALGVEQLSVLGGGLLPQDPEDIEVAQGATLPAAYAMRAKRYIHEYGLRAEQMALVSVKSHRNAAYNPYAHFNQPWTVADVVGSRMVADPLTLYMCCPNSDGAAAAVVTSEKLAKKRTQSPVTVAASVLVSGHFNPGPRDLTRPETTVVASRKAYEEAGVGPEDLDMIECHDAFAIAEILYYEIFGLAPPGEGAALLESGATEIGGRIPVNPSGGLLARGHPIGATGLAQVAEAYWQLTGRAGARQVAGRNTALTHVTGGGISGYDNGACTVHILKRG